MKWAPGVDVWPLLMNQTSVHPRSESGRHEQLAAVAWVPTTAWSILAQLDNGTILKLITEARRSNFFLANGTHLPDSTGECVPNSTSARQPK